MVSTFIGEFAIFIVQVSTIVFNFDLSERSTKLLELFMMFTVLCAMGIQFLISIYLFIKGMVTLWKKIEKDRSLKFVAATKGITSLNGKSFRN